MSFQEFGHKLSSVAETGSALVWGEEGREGRGTEKL